MFRRTSTTNLTSIPIPFENLTFGERYFWRCIYTDTNGHPSPPSLETSFLFGGSVVPGNVVLNEVLATEIVCVLRYKNHYYMATGIHADPVAQEFLQHATEEQQHADDVANRIVQSVLALFRPQLVPRSDLHAAVALNSVGINISRAIGPALAGLVITAFGMASPFFLNAASFVGVILALLWWPASHPATGALPAERFGNAIRTGLRYARESRPLRATLVRSASFFLFASAYWALLPLIARDLVAGGPGLYGILLGMIGAGAVMGAFALPRLRAWLGPDRLTAVGAVGTALALILFALARDSVTALAASFVSGVTWIAVLSSLNVSAQVALPDWVRARGLAVFVTAMFAAMTLGSIIWGQVAETFGLPIALQASAAGALVAVAITWRWKLQTGAGIDLAPSMHWPAPIVAATLLVGRPGPGYFNAILIAFLMLVALDRHADRRGRVVGPGGERHAGDRLQVPQAREAVRGHRENEEHHDLAEREQRLAAALRDNLRKRKAQARGREAGAPSSGDEET